MSYPDNFCGTPYDARPLRGDDLDDAVELESDHDALFAIDEARTAYRAALTAQTKYLSKPARAMLREYLDGEEVRYDESGLPGRLQSATELDL